jgi:DNA-binding NarL/FixJ family response regulator
MDVLMPNMDGLEATGHMKSELPRTSVLVLTAVEDPDYLSEALKAGAAGYVQKGATTQETIGAVRKVRGDDSVLDQELATQLLKRLMEDPKPGLNGRAKGESLLGLLSVRESEVLGLVARGYTNQQISRYLLISVSTVKKHLRGVVSKLGVSDRTQAAVRAFELGVLAKPEGATSRASAPSSVDPTLRRVTNRTI